MSKLFRIAIKSLASIAGIVILLIVFINLPFSRNLLTGRVNGLFRKLELPLNIQTIQRVGLKKVEVQGVSIVDPSGDTIIYAQNVKTHIKLLALTKSKVILDKTDLSGAGVKLLMNYQTRDYTLAEAFKKKKPADPEKKGSNWEVKIQNGKINSAHFFMEDSLSGIHVVQDLDELRIRRFRLGLLEQELKAHTFELTGARGRVKISPRHGEKEETKNKVPVPWNYGVKNLGLEDIDFAFEQAIDSMLLKFEVEKGVIETRQMDISGKIIDLNEISIKGARVGIFGGLEERTPGNTGKSKTHSFPWNIKSSKVNLERVDISSGTARNQAFESPSEGLGMKGLEMKLDDFQISQVDVGMKLKRLAFNINNGFTLKQMEADLTSDSESTSINMKVETGSSRIDLKGEARLSFFDFLNNPYDLKDGHLQVNDALVSLSDITSFTPIIEKMSVYPQFAASPTGFDARMDMVDGKLTLSEFFLTQKQKFKLALHGFAEHPFKPTFANGRMELTISDINTPWLKKLLPGTGIDSILSDTTDLMLSASISERFNSPEIVAQLSSNIGMIDLSGHLNFKNRAYYLNSLFGGIHLGGILDIPGLGTFTGSAKIEGSGLSAETVDSKLELLIDSINYNGYTYTQTTIEGTLKPGEYDLILLANDPAFRSTLSLNLLQNDSLFTANASGTLFAQLDRLNFVKDTISVATDLSATLAKKPNALETGLSLQETKLTSPSESAMLQNVAASYRTDTSRTSLTGEGDFFTLDIQVDKSIHEMDGFATSYGNYLRTFVDSSNLLVENRVTELPGINASCKITNHEVLDILFQDTSLYISDLNFLILNEPANQMVRYEIEGSNINYGIARLGEFDLVVIDSAGVLNLNAIADSSSILSSPPSIFEVSAQLANWSSLTEIIIQNRLKDTIYDIEFASVIDNNMMFLSVPSQHLILNHESWQLDSAQILSIELDSFKLSPQLKMRTGSSYFELSAGLEKGLPDYRMEMDHVKFTSLLWGELIADYPEGYISGNIDLTSNLLEGKRIETDLSIRNVRYSDLEFNHVKIDGFLAINDLGQYSTNFSAKLDTSLIKVEGDNILSESRSLIAEYSHVPLNIIQPFTRKYLSELTGYVSGNFEESNLSESDKFTGSLTFGGTKLKVVPLNTVLTIPDQSIQFAEDRIVLNDFRVQDTLNKSILVDGFIDFRMKPIYTDLNISSSELQLMNTTELDHETFFGQLFVDSNISFKGPFNNPNIVAKILLSKGTRLNFNYKDDVDLSESSELVNFTSYNEIGEPVQVKPIVGHTKFHMSSVETSIEIDPSTRINFGLSKRIFNINLNIQGGGLLNYSMLNNNQISLAGRYEISDGSAKLNIVGWPNKDFVISKGGYVNWDGNLENPELKFEAVSKVSSSYTNPVDGRMRNVDFNVILLLSQQLSDLSILFTIDTEDQYLMSIINTLSPEEKMRQAITILLFEIIDLPGISTSSDYMSQQVSQILASQLNQLTKSAIKGVDISFGIDTYTQSVQGGGENTSTSLSYEVKKSLLNDRAKIELSGRLQNPNDVPGAPDQALNNVSFEYQLDSAQTKYLKVYNEQTYEDVFEGQVTKTGVGFTYRKPYRSFGDIWKRKKKRNEK